MFFKNLSTAQFSNIIISILSSHEFSSFINNNIELNDHDDRRKFSSWFDNMDLFIHLKKVNFRLLFFYKKNCWFILFKAVVRKTLNSNLAKKVSSIWHS